MVVDDDEATVITCGAADPPLGASSINGSMSMSFSNDLRHVMHKEIAFVEAIKRVHRPDETNDPRVA